MAKETEEMKHSPLPWKKNEVDVRGRIPVHDGQNVCIALVEFLGTVGNRIETRKANAEFIVHCVNTHVKLVEALKKLVDISLRIGLEDSQPMRDEMAEAVVGAEAALAEEKK